MTSFFGLSKLAKLFETVTTLDTLPSLGAYPSSLLPSSKTHLNQRIRQNRATEISERLYFHNHILIVIICKNIVYNYSENWECRYVKKINDKDPNFHICKKQIGGAGSPGFGEG